MIVTLAGHVDHGKTSLVRAMTGVNTDRLADEQERGLTIDLGFAYIDDGAIGFVDVPGHHKFIHNMVAGVARHQHALLVIAADDGPMPQSREHLDILSMIGLKDGAIALTKCDLVGPERIEACKDEIARLVAGSFLENAPIFTTAAEDPDTIAPLLAHLREHARQQELQQSPEPFRLAIDRAFVIKGAGLVVTGTVHSGEVSLDDALVHFPSDAQVRVRSIRAQDKEQTKARTGDRCALNLTGLDVGDVTRGDWLCEQPPARYTNVSVDLKTLAHFPRSIKHWTPVHVYHATSHSTGRIALLDANTLAPGDSAIVDLALDEPMPCCHGDQLVIRDQSLDLTIGGGAVLFGEERHPARRRAQARLDKIKAYATDDWIESFERLIATGPVDLDEFTRCWLLTDDAQRAQLANEDVITRDGLAVSTDHWQRWREQVFATVEANPAGVRENALPASVPGQFRRALLDELTQQKKIASFGGVFKLPEQATTVPEALQSLWEVLQTSLDEKQAPSTGDLAKTLKQPQMMLEVKMRELAKLGLLVEIANHRFYLPSQLQAIAGDVKALASGKPFTVREFRDNTGIGRNVAIEVLEYFDSRGFTRRQDNERILLREDL